MLPVFRPFFLFVLAWSLNKMNYYCNSKQNIGELDTKATPTVSGARRKKFVGAKCDVVIYDVINQIVECDTDKPTDITTSEWLVVTLIWTRRPSGLMCSCTRPVWPGMS